MPGSGSLETLRSTNRARILAALEERGEASRSDLIQVTGLARTTVSSLVGDLLLEGVVVERGEMRGPTGGRPSVLLSLDPGSGAFVGVDLDHDGVRVVVVDRAGAPLGGAHEALDVDADADAALDAAERLTWRILKERRIARDRLRGAGAAVAAPLNPGGRLATQAILRGWDEVDVAAALRARLRVPVVVGNDANLGALAEVTFGAAAGATDVLYVMLSAGVGLGMILRGRLYEGYRGVAGELGHVVVDPTGRVCRCGGRGCLETVAGTHAVLDAVGAVHGEVELDEVLRLVASGDVTALAAVRSAGEQVGITLAGMCRVLDPAVVVVGGELAAAGNALVSPVRAAFAGWERAPRILRGTLWPEAEALGAAAAAMRTAAALTKQHM